MCGTASFCAFSACRFRAPRSWAVPPPTWVVSALMVSLFLERGALSCSDLLSGARTVSLRSLIDRKVPSQSDGQNSYGVQLKSYNQLKSAPGSNLAYNKDGALFRIFLKVETIARFKFLIIVYEHIYLDI